MSDLERLFREDAERLKLESEKKAEDLKNFTSRKLPIAILFYNEMRQEEVDKEQIRMIFDGVAVEQYQALQSSIIGLELVSHLASYLDEDNYGEASGVVVVFNAKESGFDMIRLMDCFEHCFYITTVDQAAFLDKLDFFLEERENLDHYARQVRDELWHIYDAFRNELIGNGFLPDAMENEFVSVNAICYKEDALSKAIDGLISNIRRK